MNNPKQTHSSHQRNFPDRKHFSPLLTYTMGVVIWTCANDLRAVDELVRFIPATLENTTLADGTALEVVEGKPSGPQQMTHGSGDAESNNHWHWVENVGSGLGDERGVFAAAGQHDNDAPMLRTTVSGLNPKSDYQVFGCFWINGFASDTATPAGNNLWDIRFGCGIAAMMGYGFKATTGYPVTLSCGTSVPWKDGVRDRDGEKRLFSANLGTVHTDAKGTLVVYVDDQAEDANEGRTWYDGIAVLPAMDKAEIGSGAPRALHRAVRCGDWEMVNRELEAGAEINVLDLDGLTPLFYACVDPDLKRIEALLKAGASPDVEGQALSPLWAAATEGRADLVELLLKSGAKIPSDPLPPNPQREKFKILARSHPAVAAIYSGSLKVLKLLLEKEPKLELDRLFASDYIPDATDGRVAYPYAVMDAVMRNHPEMALFLIDHGCQMEGPECGNNLPQRAKFKKSSENTRGSRGLLIAAVMAGPPMHGVVAALARRGMKLVDDNFVVSRFIVPWDALSAAALAGDVELTAQLLPAAEGVGNGYKTNLIVLAKTGVNAEVIALVGNRFRDVPIPRWDGKTVNSQKERITDDARVFQPRKVPFTPRTQSKGNKVMAVISDPDSAGPAAAITAKASAVEGWVCVEREQIETLLQESRLAKPWDDAAQDLSGIGDRLSADLLIIVSKLKSEKLGLLRIEAIDVRSGLPIDRLHLDEKEFKPETFCNNYLVDIRKKLEERLSGKETTAITLLPITVEQGLGGSASLEGLLHAGLLQEIDQTSGMITLTREQMQPLAEEKIFGQTGKLWGAAWTIEGGLSQLDNNRSELTLRLISLGKDGQTRDVKMMGQTDDLHSLVKAAWAQIAAIVKVDPASSKPKDAATPEQRAGTEAARLLREAEWLHNIARDHDASPLIDAALYLGADPLKTNLLRMNIHMAMRNYRVWGRFTSDSSKPTQPTPELPVYPSVSDEAVHHLEQFLELVRINSETLDRVEKISSDSAKNVMQTETLRAFLWNMDTLVFYRSVLQPGLMTPKNVRLLEVFDAELDRHVKRLFPLIQPTKEGCELLRDLDDYGYLHFNAVPALSDALAGAIVRIFDCSKSDFNYTEEIFSRFIDAPTFQGGEGLIPNRVGIMCDSLEKAVTQCKSPFKNLRLAEIKFLRSAGEQRTVAARELLRERISSQSTTRKLFSDWVPPHMLACWSPMPTSDYHFSPVYDLRHGDSLIPSLLYVAGQAADQIFRQNHYSEVAAELFSIKEQNASAWFFSNQVIAQRFESRLNRMVTGTEPASEFDILVSNVHLMDRLLGLDVARKMEPKILRVRPKQVRKYFGSKNQFPSLEFEGAINGKILADLRSGITDKPAVFIHPMVDPKNRNLLWLILQPYEDWDFKLDEPIPPSRSYPMFATGQPWLLAIDCRDGHAVHKINLAKASGYPHATSPRGNLDSVSETGLFFNDTHLLVKASWNAASGYGPGTASTLMINRETGAVEKLPDLVRYRYIQMPGSLSVYQAAVGVGDSFFIVQETESEGTILWRVKSGEKPVILAQSGRRPEQSPFDAEDQKIHYVGNEDGKLLVASSWERYRLYDLQSGTWITDPKRPQSATRDLIEKCEFKHYQARLFPQHQFKHEVGRVDVFSGPQDSQPGRLMFNRRGGSSSGLPVSLKPPDSYHARFQVTSPPANDAPGNLQGINDKEYDWVSMVDLTRSYLLKPAIMNQTEENFILSATFGFHSRTNDSRVHLPFLWIIDKPTMLSGIKNAQRK